MLSRAPIVILDEPSSSLDAVTEAHIMQAIGRLTAGRTALIIAHSLKTVVEADCIFVLDQGHVAQCGTHTKLLEEDGPYRTLWKSMASDISCSDHSELPSDSGRVRTA
jgi:ATP-binding cassette subfamily B protein